ncbi:MAG: methyltransferase domain-containing protein [Candidatus Accumulibacter sp.]|jgi:tRNA (guanine-N7-)-methyltransferase|nr:methyltransferase domain-containing protein [Accumulibacter sp.]MBO3715592.1 methyltransferase domain-containing protein [Accumulibacter sp.]
MASPIIPPVAERRQTPGNSRVPTSAQTTMHEHLPILLARHTHSPFRKPYADHNRVAFADSFERFLRNAPGSPLILDSCCGGGESSVHLARQFPSHYVIGVDQSAVRLARQQRDACGWPPNLDLVRADVVDYWRLLHDSGVRLARHYLLYPNPWPKIGHLGRRWHGHPVFPTLLGLAGVLECRSNWPLYVEELCFAVQRLTRRPVACEPYCPAAAMTPFERKYLASGHRLFRTVIDLG